MKVSILLAGLVVVGLIAGILSVAASYTFAAGVDVKLKAKIAAANSLRQTAQNINNNPTIPDPPRNDIVAKLNDRANQIDPSGGCGGFGGCG